MTISKRLAHAKPSVTLAIYVHMFTSDDSKAAAAINGALSREGGNRVAMFTFVLPGACAKSLKIQVWRGGRVAEGGGLLNRYTV